MSQEGTPDGRQADERESEQPPAQNQNAAELKPWPEYVKTATDLDISERFRSEIVTAANSFPQIVEEYLPVLLLLGNSSIDTYVSDRIFESLRQTLQPPQKNVLLILHSTGGSIEPAYQISKLCKSFSKAKFVVALPRLAKSAATLIALGADEIHMGPVGELGPIDPQVRGMPALGVMQAVERIASVTDKYPKASEMFAKYLQNTIRLEQIGYCERICESAVQYAERLLSIKPSINGPKASEIARRLVYHYKDHGFVIDFGEATGILGSDWVKTGSMELQFAEAIYSRYDFVSLFLNAYAKKYMMVMGALGTLPLLLEYQQ